MGCDFQSNSAYLLSEDSNMPLISCQGSTTADPSLFDCVLCHASGEYGRRQTPDTPNFHNSQTPRSKTNASACLPP